MKKSNLIFLLAASVLTSACDKQEVKTSEQNTETTEAQTVSVQTTLSKEVFYTPKIEYSGTALPYREANLGSPLPGRLEKLYFKKGDFVHEGELIAQLSQNMLAQSSAELDAILKDYERVKRLQEKGSLTQQDLDHISAKLKATRAQNNMFTSYSEIRAPFSGKIVDYLVNEGEVFTIAPGLQPGYSMTSGVVRLMQIDKIKICIEINEKEYASVKKGMKAQVFLDAYPDKIFEGQIASVSDYLSTRTRSAEVEIVIDNKNELIKPGMFARVEIEKTTESAVFIPQEAICRLEGTGEEYIYRIVGDNQVKRLTITREGFMNDKVAVHGIPADVEVLVNGQRKVNDGDYVIVAE